MVFFWILTVLMILLGLWFVIPPLLSKDTQAELGHDDLNVSIYRQKLADLENNEENLSPEELAQARQEIEQSLMQDVASNTQTTSVINTGIQRQTVIAVAIMVPLLALLLYWTLAPEQFQQMVNYDPQTVTKKSAGNLPPVSEMVAKLEAKMQQKPDDPKGWQLLGRSYFVMGRYDDAAMAYGRAHALAGDEPDLLADYAEALAMSLNGQLQGRPQELIGRALAKQPLHPKSLWLAGTAEFQTGKFSNAITHWQQLLDLHPDKQSEGARVLQQRIAEARQQQGGKAAPFAQAQAKTPARTAPKKAAGSTVVQVQVQLDPGLKAKARATDTVFIFARAVKGPPMPLAIVKKQVKDLPLNVKLDDSMAMMANMTMSSFPQVYIGARISKSGNAMPQSGDLQGRSNPISTGKTENVKITISQEVL